MANVLRATNPIGNGATPNGSALPARADKSHPYPPLRPPPYRPPPNALIDRSQVRRKRNIWRRCCIYSGLLFLFLVLILGISVSVFYLLYRPQRPIFSIPALRIHRLNLTASADSTYHLSTLINLTITSKNPNSHLAFIYDRFNAYLFSRDVLLGNGSLPAFQSSGKNETTFRKVILSGSSDVYLSSILGLQEEINKKRKKRRIELEIQLNTKICMKLGRLETKKIGFRATCNGIKGDPPSGKHPSVGIITKPRCETELRFKILTWTF